MLKFKSFAVSQCAQLSGKVNHQGNVLECTRVILMSPNFDMENYDKAITLASSAKFAHLFNDN